MDRYRRDKISMIRYRCYLCKENPSFITKEFYDNHHRRFHETKRYENITQQKKLVTHHQEKIMARNNEVLKQLNPVCLEKRNAKLDTGLNSYDDINNILARQGKDVEELFSKHELISKLIVDDFQNNNRLSEVDSVALFETKAKVEEKLSKLQDDILQLRARRDEGTKKFELRAFDVKNREDVNSTLSKEKVNIEEKLKEQSEKDCETNSNKNGDKELLFESFAKFIYGNKNINHGFKDRLDNAEKYDDLTCRMGILEDEVKSIKEKKLGFEEKSLECQNNISGESVLEIINWLRNEKSVYGKQIEELKSELNQLKEDLLNERNKNDQIVHDLNDAGESVNRLKSEINANAKQEHCRIESNKSEAHHNKSKLVCELKSSLFEKIDCLHQCDGLINEFTMQLNNAEEYDEVQQLKHEIEAALEERENIGVTINEAIHEIDELQKVKNSICIKCETDIYKYEQENADVCEKLKINDKKMSELQKELDKAKENLEVSRCEVNQVNNMVSKLNFQQEELSNDMKKICKENTNEKQKSSKLALKVKEYQSNMNSQKQEIKTLKEENKKLMKNQEIEFDQDKENAVSKNKFEDLTNMLGKQKKISMEEIEKNSLLIKELNELTIKFKKETKELENSSSDLKDRADKVDEENQNLNKDLYQASCDIEMLKNQLKEAQEFENSSSDLKDHADKVDEENQNLNEDLLQAKWDIEMLRNQLKEAQKLENSSNDLKDRADKVDEENQNLNKDLYQASCDIEMLKNQLKEAQELENSSNDLKDRANKVDEENQNLNKDLLQASCDIEMLRNQLKEAQELENSSNDLKDRADKVDEENQNLNKDLLQAKWDIEMLRNQLKTERESKEKEMKSKELSELEHAKLLDEVKKKENQHNEKFKRITELQSKMLKKDKIISAKDDLLEAAYMKVKQLETEANDKEGINDNEISDIEKNEQLLEEANSSAAQLNEQVLLLNKQLEDMSAKVEAAEHEAAASQFNLDDQHSMLVDIQGKYKFINTQFECKVNEISVLTTDIEELRNAVETLEEAKVTHETKEEHSRNIEAKLERKLVELQGYCEQLVIENGDLLKKHQVTTDEENKKTSSNNKKILLYQKEATEVAVDEKHESEIVDGDSDWDEEPLADEPLHNRDDKTDHQQDMLLSVSAKEENIPSLFAQLDIRPETNGIKSDDDCNDDISDEESVDFDDDIDDLLNGLDIIDKNRSSGYSPSWS